MCTKKRVSDLDEGIVSQGRAGEGGCGSQEAGVCDLLDGLTDAEDQGGVDERHDDVGVELV